MKFYTLVNEDLTHLGGPMGSEYTTTRWEKYFETLTKAQAYAEKDYGKLITWVRVNRKKVRSHDLLHTMYHITEVQTEP